MFCCVFISRLRTSSSLLRRQVSLARFVLQRRNLLRSVRKVPTPNGVETFTGGVTYSPDSLQLGSVRRKTSPLSGVVEISRRSGRTQFIMLTFGVPARYQQSNYQPPTGLAPSKGIICRIRISPPKSSLWLVVSRNDQPIINSVTRSHEEFLNSDVSQPPSCNHLFKIIKRQAISDIIWN
jgi:hypothetical protein